MRSIIITCCVLSMAASGCTSLSSVAMPFAKKPAVERPVVDVLALWQPGEGRDVNGLPTRGFAGQVFFFEAGSREPVPVDGEVTIVVFDDQGTREEQQKPVHEFRFQGGVWNSFEQTSNLGPAYQLFVPYTREGSHQAVCSLRVKYADPGGRQVISESASVLLVGDVGRIEPVLEIKDADRPKRQMTSERILSSKETKSINGRALRNAEPVGRAAEAGFPADIAPLFGHTAIPKEAEESVQSSEIEQVSYQLKPAAAGSVARQPASGR